MTMSHSLTVGGKSQSAAASSPVHSPPTSSSCATTSFDSSRRSESSRRSASTAAAAVSIATPRNIQNRKKQHKSAARRSRFEDEDEMAESVGDGAQWRYGEDVAEDRLQTAVRNANSRRGQTSITHLMSFSLPPRPQPARNGHGYGAQTSRRSNVYGIGSGRHSIDKARYVHANYRFIVKPGGDYKPLSSDADFHLAWDSVLQVLASAQSQDASCPICLSHPVAPRMAKCGHIFCLPCLIRYMHSTDDAPVYAEKRPRWKKCPICWDSVYISETRPIRWFTGQETPMPNEGDDIVLRLVMRQPGSTLALPRDGADALGPVDDIPWHFAAEVMDYARVMKGNEDYMLEQYDQEIQELQRQENEDELMFGEEPEWTQKAVRAVQEAKEKIRGIGNAPATPLHPGEKSSRRRRGGSTGGEPSEKGILVSNPDYAADRILVSNPHDAADVDFHTHTTTANHPTSRQNGRRSGDAPYYFYQALLHYYLAPLDIRILKAAFGDFAAFPATILPRVERISTGHIVDDELRKRTKYLAHLPYGCEVGFLECNWTDVVEPKVLSSFQDEIERRRKRNQEKEYREEKERQRAEKAEDDARWAAVRQRRPGSPRVEQFHSAPVPVLDPTDASPPWPSRNGASFASLASPSTSPSTGRTVWGTAAIPRASPELANLPPEDPADDGWLAHWEAQLPDDADAALMAQMQAVSLVEAGPSTAVSMTSSAGKKRKAKKITLMSTTARRAA